MTKRMTKTAKRALNRRRQALRTEWGRKLPEILGRNHTPEELRTFVDLLLAGQTFTDQEIRELILSEDELARLHQDEVDAAYVWLDQHEDEQEKDIPVVAPPAVIEDEEPPDEDEPEEAVTEEAELEEPQTDIDPDALEAELDAVEAEQTAVFTEEPLARIDPERIEVAAAPAFSPLQPAHRKSLPKWFVILAAIASIFGCLVFCVVSFFVARSILRGDEAVAVTPSATLTMTVITEDTSPIITPTTFAPGSMITPTPEPNTPATTVSPTWTPEISPTQQAELDARPGGEFGVTPPPTDEGMENVVAVTTTVCLREQTTYTETVYMTGTVVTSSTVELDLPSLARDFPTIELPHAKAFNNNGKVDFEFEVPNGYVAGGRVGITVYVDGTAEGRALLAGNPRWGNQYMSGDRPYLYWGRADIFGANPGSTVKIKVLMSKGCDWFYGVAELKLGGQPR